VSTGRKKGGRKKEEGRRKRFSARFVFDVSLHGPLRGEPERAFFAALRVEALKSKL